MLSIPRMIQQFTPTLPSEYGLGNEFIKSQPTSWLGPLDKSHRSVVFYGDLHRYATAYVGTVRQYLLPERFQEFISSEKPWMKQFMCYCCRWPHMEIWITKSPDSESAIASPQTTALAFVSSFPSLGLLHSSGKVRGLNGRDPRSLCSLFSTTSLLNASSASRRACKSLFLFCSPNSLSCCWYSVKASLPGRWF